MVNGISGSLGTLRLPLTRSVHSRLGTPNAAFVNMREVLQGRPYLNPQHKAILDRAFILYRGLCNVLYNFAQSGHPGGSISVGRQFLGLFLTGQMDYDIANPWDRSADICSLAAGHKAMGWYAFNAILNEAVRQSRPELLSDDLRYNFRFEDLLGFRKNEAVTTPLRAEHHSRCLDGHPTPATPFTFLATGASGVGVGATAGLAIAARDIYRELTPRVYCLEGEGGMTPGRVEEVLQIAERAQLGNFIMVVDHNDASIDVPGVCAGDYTRVKPEERGLLHEFNTIVADGKNFDEIAAALDYAREYFPAGRPVMIVFRTEKGEGYGLGTNKCHGSGHKMDSAEYFKAQEVLEQTFNINLPRLPEKPSADQIEKGLYESLLAIREALKKDEELRNFIAEQVEAAGRRLAARNKARASLLANETRPYPILEPIFTVRDNNPKVDLPPQKLAQAVPGTQMALREALAICLGELNRVTNGAFILGAADLYGSVSFSAGVPYSPIDASHLDGRSLATGITEDASSAVMAGISTFGRHLGVYGSYAAFLTPMGLTAARLHAIAHDVTRGVISNPLILVGAHAGPETGEDGPTHADPQSLSAWASFPRGLAITLTPWSIDEVWPLLLTALRANPKPAVIVPFVTRPPKPLADRQALGLAPAITAIDGVYHLKEPGTGKVDAWVILQGAAVANQLIGNNGEVIKDIENVGLNIGYAYVSSAELFDALSAETQREIWNQQMAMNAMGITDFTMDTMMRWVMSDAGRQATLHPFRNGHFLGSGIGTHVLRQGGLDAEHIRDAVIAFAKREVI